MKKLVMILAIALGFATATKADNVEGAAKTSVKVTYNGFNYCQVAITNANDEAIVKIYSSDFELLHSGSIKDIKTFDIKQLKAGSYILKVEKEGKEIYTEVLRKLK